MSTSHLALDFRDDGDGTGELVVRATANGFAGQGSAYLERSRVEAFAIELAAFPLPGRVSLVGGFGPVEGPLEETLAIVADPLDRLGHIAVQFRGVASFGGHWPLIGAGMEHRVALTLTTSYEPLRQFCRAVMAVLRGDADVARLDGE